MKVSKTEPGRNAHPRVTERDGKYLGRDRKRDVEPLKEEEQVAVVDNVDKSTDITFVLKDKRTQQSW